jgi:cytochrome P450
MFYDDPPYHTRIRGITAPLFLPANIRKLEAEIEAKCAAVLDECLERGEFDVAEDLGVRLAVYMISRLIGLPEEAASLIRQMTRMLEAHDGEFVFWREPDPKAENLVAEAGSMMNSYFKTFIDERRKTPRDDIFTELLVGGLTDREASGLAQLLVLAGQATTANLISNMIVLLLRYPDQLALLRADPSLVPNTVEESLRMSGQIRKLERIATRDLEVGGIPVEKGQFVALWLASANRDPRVIDRPDDFLITRPKVRHVTFGTGIHMCVGNALARIEAQIVLRQLLSRVEDFDFAFGDEGASVVRGTNPAMDMVEHVHVRAQAAH